MADLLGVSKKAVQSYEQGWRNVPPHIEQMLLLQAILCRGADLKKMPSCWKQVRCKPSVRARCPASHIPVAGFCWLVTGTLCHGERVGTWKAKRSRCLKCVVLERLMGKGEPG